MAGQGWRFKAWHALAIALALASAFCGLVAATLMEARQDNWERASQSAHNLAHAMAEEIERTVESLDLSLQGVADNSQNPAVMNLPPALRDLVLFDRAANAKKQGFLALLDASGNVVAASPAAAPTHINFADRSDFAAQRANPGLGLVVSEPFWHGPGNQASIALSRRVVDDRGVFQGVAIGTIRLEALREQFAAMDLGPRGSLTLFHDDGTLLMRVPYRDGFIGSDVSASEVYHRAMRGDDEQFVAVSSIDRTAKLHSLDNIRNAPLRLVVSFSVNAIEAGWRRYTFLVGAAAAILVLLLVAAAFVLTRELRKRQAAEAATRESEANFRLLAESSGDMVSRIGPNGICRYVSPASLRLLGRPPGDLVGHRPEEHIHPNDAGAVATALASLHQQSNAEVTVSYRIRRADGSWIWLESLVHAVHAPETGQQDGVVAVSRNVTERKKVETELARLATLDGLTGIANRRSLDEALTREWRRCARAELPLSLLLIDVDRFKALNDSQGHQRGDECLRRIGGIIGTTVRRASDLAARYGGEEFVIMLPETDAGGAAAVAERVRAEVEALALPHAAGGLAGGMVTVSVGGATLWPIPGEDEAGLATLIKMADQCLYEAKRCGRNRTVHDAVPYLSLVPALAPHTSPSDT